MTRWNEMPGQTSNQQQGRNFEELVELSNQHYLKVGLAKILKNEPTIGIVKNTFKDGKFQAYFKKKGKLDYSGCVADGRAIAFECKSTTREKFYLSVMQEHQVEKIRSGMEVGEVTFVLIEFVKYEEYYICTAKMLLEKYDKTPSGSIKRENLVRVENQGGRLDYMPVLWEIVRDGL